MEESGIVEWIWGALAKQEVKTFSTYGVYVAPVIWSIGRLIDKSDKIVSFLSSLLELKSKKLDLRMKELEVEQKEKELKPKLTNRKK